MNIRQVWAGGAGIMMSALLAFYITSCGTKDDYDDTYECEATVNTSGNIDGHDYVDLGLSVKWATCNVGATTPGDRGNYYAWGEVSAKSEYTLDSYLLYFDDGGFIKYTKSDGKSVLETDEDAAVINWGGSWRMPTKAEIQELIDNCKFVPIKGYVQGYRSSGYLLTSRVNGNTLFLPCGGDMRDSGLNDAGNTGNYWTSDLCDDNHAYVLRVEALSVDNESKYFGCSVRAVCK